VLFILFALVSCREQMQTGACSTWLTCFERCKGIESGMSPTSDQVVTCGEACAAEEELPPLNLDRRTCETANGDYLLSPLDFAPTHPAIVGNECYAALVLEEIQATPDSDELLWTNYSNALAKALFLRSRCVADDF